MLENWDNDNLVIPQGNKNTVIPISDYGDGQYAIFFISTVASDDSIPIFKVQLYQGELKKLHLINDLPVASSTVRGGVKVGYSANGKNYPVQLSDEKMYVNVPWTDTNTTYSPSITTPKVAGTASVGSETSYARGDHVHPAQTSVSGNAGTATKLATVRTIGINGGATGTPTNFDGSDNINIPITSVKEAYLEWGGKNFAGSYGPIDAAMIPSLGANRLAFMPAAGIEVQYSTNNGSSWSTFNASDSDKIRLFTDIGATFYIGANANKGIDKSAYQLRVIITTDTANVYTALNKFCIYCSTNGSTGSWCTIDAKTKANVDAGSDTWTTFANKVSLNGWSGYNIINTSNITTYGNDVAHYQKLRFTFGVTSHASSVNCEGLAIYNIMGFGGVGWKTPSTMAKTGHMYTYDYTKNVSFPAVVTATSFNGNATSATKLATARTINGVSFDGTANITIADSTKLPTSGGTMTGALVAQANANYTTAQVRNVIISANAPSGTVPDGTIWYQYE